MGKQPHPALTVEVVLVLGFARLEFQTEKKQLKVGLYFSGQKV